MMAVSVDRQEESDMSRTVRTIALAAVLVLAASAAHAAPPSAASIWDWVVSWVSPAGWRAIWENEGCQKGPNGQPCGLGESRLHGQGGRGVTPFWDKAGCEMDPNGQPCLSGEKRAKGSSDERTNLIRHGRN